MFPPTLVSPSVCLLVFYLFVRTCPEFSACVDSCHSHQKWVLLLNPLIAISEVPLIPDPYTRGRSHF